MANDTLTLEKELTRYREFYNAMNRSEDILDFTPRQPVWKKNKATLWHYPAVGVRYDVPVFIIYSLFNRPGILDFSPGTSVIQYLVNKGFDVYLLDWGIAGFEDKDINLEDYIADYVKKGVQRALRHSGADEITVMGYCLGGTFAAMYAAIAEEPIKNLVVAAVPIDFSFNALPDKWAKGIKEGMIDTKRVIELYGLISPAQVEAMFRSVTAPVYLSPYVTLFARAHDKRFVEKWKRMNTWTDGHVPLTGGALRQLTNDFLKENKLVKGEFSIREMKVDLRNIHQNLLVVTSKNDFLIPESSSLPLMDLVSSKDKTYLLENAGHVSLAMTGKFNKILDGWLPERSNQI